MPARILLFLLLGAGSLLLETAWVHRQVVMFGAHPAAWGSVLAVFFAGTAAGAQLMVRRDWRDIPRPLRLAGPPVAVLLSLVLPSSLDRFVSVLPVSGMAMDLARWIIVPSALFPACLLFGIVFPVLARRTGPAPLILLYGMQALGSFWGIYLGAFRLPYVAGHRLSGLAGGLLVIVAILLLELVALRVAPSADRAGNALPRHMAVLAFGSGICSILLQVLWTRLIALVTDDSVYAFGSVSLLVLSLLVVAGIVVAALPERIADGSLPLALALAVCAPGILLAAGIFLAVTDGLSIRLISSATGLWPSMVLASTLVIPGQLAPAFPFALLLRRSEEHAGHLVAVNALGCLAGSLAAPLLIFRAGTWGMMTVACLGYALLGAWSISESRWRWCPALPGLVLVAAVNPLRFPMVTPANPFGGEPGTTVWAAEGAMGITAVIDYPGRERTLWLNNSYLLEAGTEGTALTRRMGLLPTALRPRAREALVIGLGTGIAAAGFLPSRLERITVAELVPEVAEAARRFFAPWNGGVADHPRVKLVVDDGRHLLRASRRAYDLICTDVITPWNERAAFLYTAEHFTEVRGHLTAGGIYLLWLPLYQLTREEFQIIAGTMAEIFPRVTAWQLGASSGSPVIGLAGSDGPIDLDDIGRDLPTLPPPDEPDLVRVDLSGLLSRYLGPIKAGLLERNGLPANTLDRPVIEHLTARPGRLLLRGDAALDLIEGLVAAPADPGGAYVGGWNAEREVWRRSGWHLLAWRNLVEQGRDEEAAPHLERVLELPALRGPAASR